MLGIFIFMVLGIVQPKATNRKTFQLKTEKTYHKREKRKRGKGRKRGRKKKGKGTFINTTTK